MTGVVAAYGLNVTSRCLWSTLLPLAALVGVGACPAQRQDDQLWLQLNTHVPIADHVRVTLE